MDLLSACWQPSADRYVHKGSDVSGRQDGLLWYKDAGQHLIGEFSMAVVQANNLLEDQSQIESGPLSLLETGPYGTFIGVYDGHGGPETSRYICDSLFQNLKRMQHDSGAPSEILLCFPSYFMTDICSFQGLPLSNSPCQWM